MHRKCFIKWCQNNMDEEYTNVSFHKFPADEWKCKKWMEALKLDEIKATASICSSHFHDSDFINDTIKNRRRLYPSAIPYLSEEFEEPQPVYDMDEESLMEISLPLNIEEVGENGIKLIDSNQINNNMTSDQPLPKIIGFSSTSNELTKLEKILLKIETLRRSECKSKKKIKHLQQKVRRQTTNLASLRQSVSNLKQTKVIPSATGNNIGVEHCNQLKTTQEIDIKPKVFPKTKKRPKIPKSTSPKTPQTNFPTTPEFTLPVLKNDIPDQLERFDTTNEASILTEDRLIFEVNFKTEEVFNEYKDLVIDGLRLSLTDKGFFVLVEDVTKIQIFREFPVVDEEQNKATDSCDTTANQMEFVIDVNSEQQTVTDAKPIEAIQNQDNFIPSSEEEYIDISGLLMFKTQPSTNIGNIHIPSSNEIKTLPSEKIETIQISSSKKNPTQLSALKTKKLKDDCKHSKQTKSCVDTIGTDHSLRTGPKPRNKTNTNEANKSTNLRPNINRFEKRFVPIQFKSIHLPLSSKIFTNLGEVVDPLV